MNASIDDGRRLRVLQVIGNAIVGGMETVVTRLCEALLVDHGCEVLCLCPYESAATHALRRLGCAIHVAPLPDEPVWRGIEYGASLVEAEGIDVIHSHLTNAHLLAGLVGKLTNTPVLSTIHGRDVHAPDIEMQRLGGTHLHVVSRATFYQALAIGIPRERVSCILNGVDADVYRPGPATGALRAACGIGPDVPLFGYVGRISKEKGPELFVRTAALALTQNPEAHAVLIGDGPQRESVMQLVRELGLGRRLHVVGLRDDVPDCLRQLDVFVSTSHMEGTPLSMMEAQATGVPVVATHVGGVPEILTMGETGVLVPPGEAHAVAAAVAHLLANPADRARLGAAARQRMVEHFSVAASNGALAALLASLAGTTSTASRPARRTTLASVPGRGARSRDRDVHFDGVASSDPR